MDVPVLSEQLRDRHQGSSAPRVLHIIERLRGGGPSNALTALAGHSRAKHRVVSLLPPAPLACALAAESELAVVSAPDPIALAGEIADADIVQLHFWNNPDVHAFMAADWPEMRVLAWSHVSGAAPPQVIPKSLFCFADVVVVTAASSLQLPAARAADPSRIALVPAGADFSRLEGTAPVPHSGVNVGYIGRVDFVKLHADFVAMCAALRVPEVRFHVCGDGACGGEVERQVRNLGFENRFVFQNYLKDIRPVISILDVFGYPLRPGNSTTADLVLQEVMFVGVPPVVLPYGGAASLVIDGQTGVVARDEAEYVRAIERLCQDPAERARLGRNAASYAREHFGARRCAEQFDAIYAGLMELSKRPHRTPPARDLEPPGPAAGAWQMVMSLDGDDDADFIASLTANETAAEEAEDRISRASPGMRDIILQYRIRYPDDAYLRLWTGLVFFAERRAALAASEFQASIARGCRPSRLYRYLAESAHAAGASAIARDALSRAGQDVSFAAAAAETNPPH